VYEQGKERGEGEEGGEEEGGAEKEGEVVAVLGEEEEGELLARQGVKMMLRACVKQMRRNMMVVEEAKGRDGAARMVRYARVSKGRCYLQGQVARGGALPTAVQQRRTTDKERRRQKANQRRGRAISELHEKKRLLCLKGGEGGGSGANIGLAQRTSLRRRETCASFDVFAAIASVFSERSSLISWGDARALVTGLRRRTAYYMCGV
jgi:hypothetical protein